MSSTTSLPTPRQLLTSILNGAGTLPLQPLPPPPPPSSSSANPLRHLDQTRRHLFATLHVLFPSLLLPALDLLDRGLVTRLLHHHLPLDRHAVGQQAAHSSRYSRPSPPPSVYVVRSAQKKAFRRGLSSEGEAVSGQGVYLVHTAAWSCTCAAFAFSAFLPAAGHGSHHHHQSPSVRPLPSVGRADGVATVDAAGQLGDGDTLDSCGFGGLSLEGTEDDGGGMPPCCKHLLACVLAEKCHALFGRHVNVRTVGREEMAGIFADV
ncbi:hypothetical protein M406DRAFT_339506 [Cryphonectria parasitica EP155]|uniref:SWIM-type domain-containing protein n=1 Tax=Cryphonectria parasitica (strain ATCC 38755 / EP155) TaxID=660469 RepID=A0A9P5CPK3_CRYP1|nr:uncharacterized protein M406DRAFT_339506 [Cryphonectria parasitica EP155]KAF3766248.1 hypothetical protein M406DRAFT_339506 [Cryphonectria parasitica EP155]